MSGLKVIYHGDSALGIYNKQLPVSKQTEKGYLTIKPDTQYASSENGNLNNGFRGDTDNYLKPIRTNDESKAAISFSLKKDENCRHSYEGQLRYEDDITKGAILHPDCRYLIPRIKSSNNNEDETPITKIFLSNTVVSCATCTDDINAGRRTVFSGRRYLCWNKEEGV